MTDPDRIWPASCFGCPDYVPVPASPEWRADWAHRCHHAGLLPQFRESGAIICIDRSSTPPHRPPWCPRELPGSPDARLLGCCCPQDQEQAFQGLYWQTEECPIHGTKS